MADQEQVNKLADFNHDPQYKRSLVIFYDVLGWHDEINLAGTDPKKIGNLRRMILMHSRLLRMSVKTPVKVSTFSDNVVISTPISSGNVEYFVANMAVLQVTAVSMGFLVRGGITV